MLRNLRILVMAPILAFLLFQAAMVRAEERANDPLPSWNDGPAKQTILQFVRDTTDKTSAKFVRAEERIATFDQDGTLWVEHPMYTQVMYCLERVPSLVEKKPELKNIEPFKTCPLRQPEGNGETPDEGP